MDTTDVNVPLVTSEAELEALLDAQGAEGTKDDGSPDGNKAKAKSTEEDEDDDDLASIDKKKDKAPKGKGQPTEEEEEEEEEGDDIKNKNYGNVIAFLNDKHKLDLNLENLPKELTREDEAEIVSDLFEKVVKGADEKLRQYEEMQTLLEDEEVVLLLKAKSEGKGLKDLYTGFSTSTEGMTNEQMIFDDLKKKYPKLPEASINNMVATMKEKGQFDEFATAAREQRKEDDTKSAQQRLQEETVRAERQRIEQKAEDTAFEGLVAKVGKINDIAFTDEMKAEVLSFTLQRDAQGLSRLDHALQSDVGVLRATLGIVLMEKLMGAKASIKVNKENKKLVDRLFEKPSQANTGSGGNKEVEEVPDEIFNRF